MYLTWSTYKWLWCLVLLSQVPFEMLSTKHLGQKHSRSAFNFYQECEILWPLGGEQNILYKGIETSP